MKVSSGRFFKFSLFIAAILIGAISLWYSNNLVVSLQQEERKKVELWAEAMREIEDVDLDGQISLIVFKIMQENNTIPVILVSENGNITHANLDSAKSIDPEYIDKQIEIMKEQHMPIYIEYSEGHYDTLYYKDSIILTQLSYYPYIQFGVVSLFILVSFFAFRSSQKAEENQLWVGMSKETAHQLGTPISSLLAWIEMLKMKDEDSALLHEVEKDVKRLETITERFSKIGSTPKLSQADIIETLKNSITYLRNRTSSRVKYLEHYDLTGPQDIPLNVALFDWVIENLCKNAIDAMGGVGQIDLFVSGNSTQIIIDVKDSGKGINKRYFKSVFKPGFTTKKRGWGLGLSLGKRIIEYYHAGKIYVKSSEPGKGTVFRIILKRF